MTTIAKSAKADVIYLPEDLLDALKLNEGDEVKAVVEGENIRLARLDEFLALRGILAEDEDFDQAMEYLDQAWNAWTPPASA